MVEASRAAALDPDSVSEHGGTEEPRQTAGQEAALLPHKSWEEPVQQRGNGEAETAAKSNTTPEVSRVDETPERPDASSLPPGWK